MDEKNQYVYEHWVDADVDDHDEEDCRQFDISSPFYYAMIEDLWDEVYYVVVMNSTRMKSFDCLRQERRN